MAQDTGKPFRNSWGALSGSDWTVSQGLVTVGTQTNPASGGSGEETKVQTVTKCHKKATYS